jgi:hypothetical protein
VLFKGKNASAQSYFKWEKQYGNKRFFVSALAIEEPKLLSRIQRELISPIHPEASNQLLTG